MFESFEELAPPEIKERYGRGLVKPDKALEYLKEIFYINIYEALFFMIMAKVDYKLYQS
jgi:hypothetical protein